MKVEARRAMAEPEPWSSEERKKKEINVLLHEHVGRLGNTFESTYQWKLCVEEEQECARRAIEKLSQAVQEMRL